jgi:hypothetical protein
MKGTNNKGREEEGRAGKGKAGKEKEREKERSRGYSPKFGTPSTPQMTAMKPQKSSAEFCGLFSLEPCYTSTIYRYRLAAKYNKAPRRTALKIQHLMFAVS